MRLETFPIAETDIPRAGEKNPEIAKFPLTAQNQPLAGRGVLRARCPSCPGTPYALPSSSPFSSRAGFSPRRRNPRFWDKRFMLRPLGHQRRTQNRLKPARSEGNRNQSKKKQTAGREGHQTCFPKTAPKRQNRPPAPTQLASQHKTTLLRWTVTSIAPGRHVEIPASNKGFTQLPDRAPLRPSVAAPRIG